MNSLQCDMYLMNVRSFLERMEPARKALAIKAVIYNILFIGIGIAIIICWAIYGRHEIVFYLSLTLFIGSPLYVWLGIIERSDYVLDFRQRVIPGMVSSILSDAQYTKIKEYDHSEDSMQKHARAGISTAIHRRDAYTDEIDRNDQQEGFY